VVPDPPFDDQQHASTLASRDAANDRRGGSEGGSEAEWRAVVDGDHTIGRRCDSDKTFHPADTAS